MKTPPAARFDNVTIRHGRRDICRDVTLAVAPGSVYVLLGREGSGKSSLLECLLGESKPTEGTAYLFEQPSRKVSQTVRSEILVVRAAGKARPLRLGWKSGETRLEPRDSDGLARALSRSPRLLVYDEPTTGLDAATREAIGKEIATERARRELTVLAASSDASAWETVVTHVGILKDGHLAVNESRDALSERFRRLLYANEITPERTEYGNELDEFDAVRVRVRGWGTEAIVSNFTLEALTRFRAIPGLGDARAEPMSLTEIFQSVAPSP